MFAGIQRYTDETQEGLPASQSIEIVQKLLHQGLKRPELKDELFMQLLKQSRGNPSPSAAGEQTSPVTQSTRHDSIGHAASLSITALDRRCTIECCTSAQCKPTADTSHNQVLQTAAGIAGYL